MDKGIAEGMYMCDEAMYSLVSSYKFCREMIINSFLIWGFFIFIYVHCCECDT